MSNANIVSGTIGVARSFNDSGYIQMVGTAASKLDFAESDFYTVSAWVFADTLDYGTDTGSGRHDMTIVAKDNCQYSLKCLRINFAFAQYKDVTGWQSSISLAVTGTWKYVVGVHAGIRQYLYIDGVCMVDSVNFVETANKPRSTMSDVTIGKTPPGTNKWAPYFFKGKIDEVRMSNVAVSADWIKLCYENQKGNNVVVQFK
jgi:hypothetical protein